MALSDLAIGTSLPGGHLNTLGGPVDPFYAKTDGTPWATLAEACAAVPTAYRRSRTVNVAGVEYHWLHTDVSDNALILKVVAGGGGGGSGSPAIYADYSFTVQADGAQAFTLPDGTQGIDGPPQVQQVENGAVRTIGSWSFSATTLTIDAKAELAAGDVVFGRRYYGGTPGSGGGNGGSLTPEQVKAAYESNPNTNAYTDKDKQTVAALAAAALPQQRTIRSLLASATLAAQSNPHLSPALASPPTVTISTAAPAGHTNSYPAVDNAALLPNRPWRYYGCQPKLRFGKLVYMVTTNVGTGGNADDGDTAVGYRIGTTTDAAQVCFRLNGGNWRFIVNGQYADFNATVVPFNGLDGNYVLLDFGSSAIREIQVEGEAANSFLGMTTTEGYVLWAPEKGLRIIQVGDSFTEASGSGLVNDGLARVTGDTLGILDYWMSGVGGTGYTNPYNTVTFINRLNNWTTKAADLVVFAGGINDPNDDKLKPAVKAVVQATRQGLPDALVIVLGCWAGSSGPDAATIEKENKIAAAVTELADPNVLFIPISTEPTGPWVTGTGKLSAPRGDGNSDIVTDGEPHPGVYGHRYLGIRVAYAIRKLLSVLALAVVTIAPSGNRFIKIQINPGGRTATVPQGTYTYTTEGL